MRRRDLLAVGGTILIAGCTNELTGGSPTPTATDTPTDSPTPTPTATATPTPTHPPEVLLVRLVTGSKNYGDVTGNSIESADVGGPSTVAFRYQVWPHDGKIRAFERVTAVGPDGQIGSFENTTETIASGDGYEDFTYEPAKAETMRPGAILALLVALAAVGAGLPVTATAPSTSHSAEAIVETPGARPPVPPNSLVTADTVSVGNTTNRLTLPSETPQNSQIQVVTLDAAGSTAVDNARIEAQFLAASIQQAYHTAPNETAARRAIRRGTARLAARIDRLVARERRARQQYTTGTWRTRTYLRELAVIDATARHLQATVEQLHAFNQAADRPVAPDRFATLKLRLLGLQGPVRAEIAAAMTGKEPATARVFVRSSATGTVLATIIEDGFSTRYVRAAYVGRAVTSANTTTTAVEDIDTARRRFRSLYPWATSFNQYNIGLVTQSPYYLTAGVYALGVNHPQGVNRRFDLEAYLDTDTGQVFREYQYLSVENVPTQRVGTTDAAGVRVTVEGTYVGGPMRVRVTDTGTGTPVNATVTVAGIPTGTTGPDGTAAALVPRETFPVTITTDGETLTVSASLSTDIEP